MKKKRWTMPDWMKPYLLGESKESVEAAMNCDASDCNISVNAPRALICLGIATRVSLLLKLKGANLLKLPK